MIRFSFVCPYCFSRVKSKHLEFHCSDPNCRNTNPGHISRSSLPWWKSVFTTILGNNPPACPHCHRKATKKYCPYCGENLPHGIDTIPSDVSIAIIGAREAGKSHYIAVLIHQIKMLSRHFQWRLLPMDDFTGPSYDERFYDPLYNAHVTIRATDKGDKEAHKPLVYRLIIGKGFFKKTIMITFYDTAGEHLDSSASMEVENRYIYNASGVILLLDPLQLPQVRSKIAAEDLPKVNSDAGRILENLANLIREGHNLSPNSNIGIPLAVSFSKIDALKIDELMGQEAPIYERSMHQGGFSPYDFQRNNEFIRNWVERLDARCGIAQGIEEFKTHAFFGLSALGCNPQATQKLDHEPRPMRVEDPFLWVLWKKGLISEMEK